MTVRSSTWQRTWTIRVPRILLYLEFSRVHVVVLATTLYVVVLLLVYLHLAGQVAAVRHETRVLKARTQTLVVENARLEAEVLDKLSVPALAEVASQQGVVVSAVPMPVRGGPHALRSESSTARQTAQESRERGSSISFPGMWARAFHLKE